jgi:hypothetical protein
VRLSANSLRDRDNATATEEDLEHMDKQHSDAQSGADDLNMSAQTSGHLVADARERKRQLHGEFGTACEEIYLLGSEEVRTAADRLWD